jgi:hypothetical protein
MTLHELVKARLKVLYPEVTLSNARIKATADKLSAKQLTVEQETEVDAALTAMNDNGQYTFSELQKEDSRILQLQILADKGKKPEKKDEPVDPPSDPAPADDEPAWFKSYREATDAKLAAFEKEKAVGTIKQKLAEKLKDVPGSIWSKRALPESEDAIDAFVTEVETDYKTDFVDKGLITQPAGGSKAGAPGKATKEEIKSIVDGIMPRN